MKNSWTKEEKATFRTQHPTKYPIKQANHNSPKADVRLSPTSFMQQIVPNIRA